MKVFRVLIGVTIPTFLALVWHNHPITISEFCKCGNVKCVAQNYPDNWCLIYKPDGLHCSQIHKLPILSKFLAQLDRYTVNLHKLCSSKGVASGQKTSHIMAIEDKDCNPEEAERGISETTLGLFVIRKEGAGAEDEPEDVGVGCAAAIALKECFLWIGNVVRTDLRSQLKLPSESQIHV